MICVENTQCLLFLLLEFGGGL